MKEESLRVSDLIKLLKTFPKNAIIVSDDGSGWLAKVRKCDVQFEKCDGLKWVQICGNSEGI